MLFITFFLSEVAVVFSKIFRKFGIRAHPGGVRGSRRLEKWGIWVLDDAASRVFFDCIHRGGLALSDVGAVVLR